MRTAVALTGFWLVGDLAITRLPSDEEHHIRYIRRRSPSPNVRSSGGLQSYWKAGFDRGVALGSHVGGEKDIKE